MKLDLHETRHADVKRKVDMFIWEAMQKKEHQVEIVTGKSDRMKAIVQECLREYKMKAEEKFMNTGALLVNL